ncbi:hypothetical protein Daus18300_006231 [Diaporthe australafricana]|uniref:Heterokaryon incompatibility domain-containing protein n=1 Tax=Diaporthe australafricana TaxID=127596 RepID=A0ABR3WVI2_9PEZI
MTLGLMEEVQGNDFLCERCSNLDTQTLLSSTRSSPWRPWQVADVVASAATTGCSFCCLLVNTLRPVTVDEQGSNGTLIDKGLVNLQSMKTKSKIAARFLAPRVERLQRERDGWITFFVPEVKDDQEIHENHSDGIARIQIAVTGSKHVNGNREHEFILAPGPGMPRPQSPSSSGSELSSLFPTGTLLQNTSQSLTDLCTAIQTWRQHCHDTHECWKPLAQRRNRNVSYSELMTCEIIRRDWYFDHQGLSAPASPYELPPLELENGRLDSVALPSRCLEIVLGDDGQCWFWLRETAGEVGKYVILSHRWVPDTARVRTLRCNYADRVGGSDETAPVAPGDVTKLFHEAAQLTAQLGVKYIWIDSLCIIQDDDDDWKHEATKMASYYENAWLTIAGSSGEGLCLPIDQEVLPPVVNLPYLDETGQRAGELLIQPVSNPHLRTLYTQAITDSELLSRGWVFQEWLLSSRIAAFSKTAGVFLVCSEDLPQSALLNDKVQERQDLPDKSYKNALDLSLVGQSDIAESWRRVVEAYSGLNLTKLTSDRLISLAGVASEFGTALGAAQNALQWRTPPPPAEYLCGLWRQDLSRGLQWEIVDRRRPLVRVPGFPSWTWASLGRALAGEGNDSSNVEAVAARWHTQWRRSAIELFELQEVRHVATDLSANPSRLDEARPIASEALVSDFGIENRFLALRISGQLRRNFRLEQAWPGGQKDLYRVAKLTANCLVSANSTESSLNGDVPATPATAETRDYKNVGIIDSGQVWPKYTSPISASFILTGAWQEEMQQPPHLKLRVRWPCSLGSPATVFNSDELAAEYFTTEMRWFPGQFLLRVREASPAEEAILATTPLKDNVNHHLAFELHRTGAPRPREYLVHVEWPVSLGDDVAGEFDTLFRRIAYQQDLTVFVPNANSNAVVS